MKRKWGAVAASSLGAYGGHKLNQLIDYATGSTAYTDALDRNYKRFKSSVFGGPKTSKTHAGPFGYLYPRKTRRSRFRKYRTYRKKARWYRAK